MDKERLKFVLQESENQPEPRFVQRDVDLPTGTGKIHVLVGIRRSGKTYVLWQVQARLLAQGVKRSQIIRLSLEDDRLYPIRPDEWDLILQAHAELHPELAGCARYFLFDEVQAGAGWERFLRRLHDTQTGEIFVTGSSSQLLSQEIATSLRGRCLSTAVYPLSFSEFLRFRGVEVAENTTEGQGALAAALDDYLDLGGLPEIVLAEPALRPRILKEYLDLVFYRDLVERHKVNNPVLLRELLRTLLSTPAALVSIHKLYQDFRSRGLSLSKDTLYSYVHYLEESLLIHLLPLCDRSLRRQSINPKKIHPVDWSLGFVFTPSRMMDLGHRLETAVALHHLRGGSSNLSYLSGPGEIDLVDERPEGQHWVNSAWSLTQETTWRREEEAFLRPSACLTRTLVVREAASRPAPKNTRIVPAWEYLRSL